MYHFYSASRVRYVLRGVERLTQYQPESYMSHSELIRVAFSRHIRSQCQICLDMPASNKQRIEVRRREVAGEEDDWSRRSTTRSQINQFSDLDRAMLLRSVGT